MGHRWQAVATSDAVAWTPKLDAAYRSEGRVALKIHSAVLFIGIISRGLSCMAAEPPAFKGIAIGSKPSPKEIEIATGARCWLPDSTGTLCVLTAGTYAGARAEIYILLGDDGTVKRIDFHLEDKAESAKDFLIEKFGQPSKVTLADVPVTASGRGSISSKIHTLTWQVTPDARVVHVGNAANPSRSSIRYGSSVELDRLYRK
jgi:hypothetical protein